LAATLLVLSMHAAGAQVGWQPFIFVVSSSLVTALCASFFSV